MRLRSVIAQKYLWGNPRFSTSIPLKKERNHPATVIRRKVRKVRYNKLKGL
jgi:hypothetical protein